MDSVSRRPTRSQLPPLISALPWGRFISSILRHSALCVGSVFLFVYTPACVFCYSMPVVTKFAGSFLIARLEAERRVPSYIRGRREKEWVISWRKPRLARIGIPSMRGSQRVLGLLSCANKWLHEEFFKTTNVFPAKRFATLADWGKVGV